MGHELTSSASNAGPKAGVTQVEKRLKAGFIRLIQIKPMVEYFEANGGDTETLCNRAGIEREDMGDPDVLVHAETVYKVWNTMADMTGDPRYGLTVAENLPLRAWRIIDMAADGATTLMDLLSGTVAATPGEANSIRYILEVGADRTLFKAIRQFKSAESPIHTHFFGLGIFRRLFDQLEDIVPEPGSIEFHVSEVDKFPTTYREMPVRGVPADGFSFSFPSAWLRARIIHPHKYSAPPETYEHSDVLLSALKVAVSKVGSVGDVSVASVADYLGTDAAALKRELARHGTSPMVQISKARQELAEEALRQGTKSITEIGRQLGWIDPSHFSRFFKRATGLSPRDFQKSHAKHRA